MQVDPVAEDQLGCGWRGVVVLVCGWLVVCFGGSVGVVGGEGG